MNIEEAKQIPLLQFVEKLGGRYDRTDNHGNIWCFSPFRPEENTASFKINAKLNTWHDFGLSNTTIHRNQGSGGDILDLWCDYNFEDRRLGIKKALAGLEELGLSAVGGERLHKEKHKEISIVQNQRPTFEIIRVFNQITHYGLLNELGRRKISQEVANIYFKQGQILNTVTNKKYFAFLFPNDKGGYEVTIPNPKRGETFKTSIGPKGSSYIAPIRPSHTGEAYEASWDFVSNLEIKKILYPIHHTWVENSNSFANEVCEKIIALQDDISFVFLFLDNDTSGFKTTNAMTLILEEQGFLVASMQGFYKDHKDVNDYLTKKPKNKIN